MVQGDALGRGSRWPIARTTEDCDIGAMPEPDELFPSLDVWAFPRPVQTEAGLYGPRGETVASMLIDALDLDEGDLWRIASAYDFDYEDRALQRSDKEHIREAIAAAAAATDRISFVRSAFSAGERAAFYAASPGLGSLDFWGNTGESRATAPAGYAAAALVVADALSRGDLDLALRAWRARRTTKEASGRGGVWSLPDEGGNPPGVRSARDP